MVKEPVSCEAHPKLTRYTSNLRSNTRLRTSS